MSMAIGTGIGIYGAPDEAVIRARQARGKAMISGDRPVVIRTPPCANCGQGDPARLALPVNGEYKCKGGCDVADADESASETEIYAYAALF